MSTVRYKFFYSEYKYKVRWVKVPLTATQSDVKLAIFNDLANELRVSWFDVEDD